ncbi:hypothetical protein JTE90_020201 [Oedothorax gibbosus]|uniref:G-protein coupled receptors family 1 profile domain-containing protein n=1 Tax=Oedothorax gibbosus TaxID=931172 RepID=A0AAV6TSN1_9ARAC|nr:hypothetical protein JTE90_020201 [Oedothorax gibbosus]
MESEKETLSPLSVFEGLATLLKTYNLTIQTMCKSTYFSNETVCANHSDGYGLQDYSEAMAMERFLRIVVPFLFGIIIIVGLIGNAFVVIVVTCNPQMRSTTNLLIFNLAIADLLFIVFCVPFTAWDYSLPYWPFGDIWCKIVQYLVIVCAYASIYTLVLMSLDRFLAVVYPITSISIRTERNAYFAISLMWIVIFICCIPALQAHGELYYEFAYTQYSVCVFLATHGYNFAAFQICFFLSSYIIPLILIFCLYLSMLRRLWFGVTPSGRMSAESVKSKKRVTKMVVAVVVMFACCWCPIQIMMVLKGLKAYGLSRTSILIQITSHVLAYMNSCLNPILYAFLSDNFRKAFWKVIYRNSRPNFQAQRITKEKNDRDGTCVTKTTKVANNILEMNVTVGAKHLI